MRRIALLCCITALAGCAKTETNAPAASEAPPPAKVSLADVAGKWTVKAMNEAKDTTLLTYEMVATADTSGWTLTFPNRKPIPMRVSTMGANVVVDAGPYPSALRKGVQVTTHGVLHLDNGKLVGTTFAHYSVTTADSVRRIATEGTRTP